MNALSVRGLTKTYGNGVQALRGVDLDVERGDFFALLGPNGAGKTTLIGIITSLVNKSGGSACVFGHDIERELEVLTEVTASLITERRQTPPWGLAGGTPGAVGENWLLPGGDERRAQRLPAKTTVRVAAGDVIRVLTPGGGGWGSAASRGR